MEGHGEDVRDKETFSAVVDLNEGKLSDGEQPDPQV